MAPRRVLKKIGIGVGVFFGLLLLAIVILPFVIDVDSYRPKIVEMANEKLNGKLEMGKLTLSLWGQVKVQVDGFTVTDAEGHKVVAAKDVFFHVPLLPLIGGKPVVTFKMQRPELNVVKNKAGKLNVMTLMKPTAPAAPAETPKDKSPTKLPSLAVNARLGVEMRDAQVAYRDLKTDLVTQVKDLNLLVKNISLSSPMELEMWADLDTRMGKTMTVKGPATVTGKFTPKINGSEFESGTLTFRADADKVAITMPDLFDKKSGVTTNAEGSMTLSPKAVQLQKLEAKFFNAVVTATGAVTDVDTTPVLDIKVASNDIALKPWSELIPMLKAYELGGTAKLVAALGGTSEAPRYNAELAVRELTAKAPNLKAQPRFDANVKVVTDAVESFVATMRAPGNDLKITGKVNSFTAPKADFLVSSTGLDLDQLIEFPKTAAKGGKDAPKEEKGETTAAGKGKATDLDASLDPVRTNPALAGMVATIRANITQIKVKGVRITDIIAGLSFRDLTFAVDQFQMGLWDGKISSTMSVAMKPKTPTYRFSAKVAGLELQQAVSSQFELFKNTLLGKASFSMDGSGASFNADAAKGNLNARGNLRVENATFDTIDVGKMASEAVNKAINDIASKVPPLKGKTVPALKSDTRYEFVASDFTVANGVFSAPNFQAKSLPGKGIDIAGTTTVNLKTTALEARWELIDTHNLTKARDISVESNGVRVDSILADGGNPVKLPVIVTGTTAAPVTNYGAVPEALAKVALANMGRAVEGKAKAELQKRLQEEAKKVIPQQAQPAINNAVKDLGKKLFGK